MVFFLLVQLIARRNRKKSTAFAVLSINKPHANSNSPQAKKKTCLYEEHMCSFSMRPVIKITNSKHTIQVFKHVVFIVVKHFHGKFTCP
jgi:hypothetical protein